MKNKNSVLASKLIHVNKGVKYLQEIMSQIPSLVIFFKTITGIGATHLELMALRWSIIIEPNVPVIWGKKKRGILGIHEGVCIQDVVMYLSDEKYKYKKILVTPESFYKVKEAALILDIDLYNSFFLLYDECERTAKDVEFRERIIEPMDDFFKFKDKAFISATALTPSDPRFAQQDFKELILVPKYDIAKKLNLVITNNVIYAFKQSIKAIPEGDKICVFYNTTIGIAILINQLGIKDDCAVFCSKDSRDDLKKSGISNAHENVEVQHIKKYNFFTSRFYAAVDIELDYNPHVFMLTELYTAQHTMIDPHSDAIQIIGRFRNGTSSINVISNIDETIPYKTEEEAKSYLEGCEHSYCDIRALKNATTNLGARETLQHALELVPFSKHMINEERKNHFMNDHFLHKEGLKSFYTSEQKLIRAFTNAKIKSSSKPYFDVVTTRLEYPLGDERTKYRNPLMSYKDKVSFVIDTLERYKPTDDLFVINDYNSVFIELGKVYPEIVKGYEVLGAEKLKSIAFSKTDVIRAVEIAVRKQENNHYQLINDLHARFHDGMSIEDGLRKEEFKKLIDKHGLSMKPTLVNFSLFFDLSNRFTCSNNRNLKCRRILRSRFQRQ